MDNTLRRHMPKTSFMAELAKTPTTLQEFMGRVNHFVSLEDTLRALTTPRKYELEQVESRSKGASGGKAQEKARKDLYDKRRNGGVPSKNQNLRSMHSSLNVYTRSKEPKDDRRIL